MAENKVIGIGLNDGVEDIIYELGGGGGIEEWKNYEEVDISVMFNDEDAPEEMVNWFNENIPNGKVKIVDICAPFFEMQILEKEPDTPPYAEGVPSFRFNNQNIEVKEGIFHGSGFIGGFLFVMKCPYWEMYMKGAMQLSDIEEIYIVSGALGITQGAITPMLTIFKANGLWYWGSFDM